MIARFGAAGREDNLVRLRFQEGGDLNAGTFDGVVGRFSVAVRAGWVAEVLAQIREHGVENGGVDRRGGVVVEINRVHDNCHRSDNLNSRY